VEPTPSSEENPLPTIIYGVKVATGDLDGDGIPEIIVGMATQGNLVQIYTPDGMLRNEFATFSHQEGIEITAGDVNQDGLAEILVGDPLSNQVLIFNGAGELLTQMQGV
jgi:hypothetical protein